jgi:16S rRNA (adenine1518-N6/adenine1519-N6)-dimethyltransferase
MIQLKARKSLGQNFLIDPKVHERIVKHIDPTPEDVIVEIGPGTGLLTKALLAKDFKKLIAFELDERAVPQLRDEFISQGTPFEVIEQDILTVDLPALAEKERSMLRIAGNIPYNITSPILFKLIEDRAVVTDAHLLVQLEVAERLTASPRTKAYGIPTVLANFFGSVKYLFKVPAGAFRPIPRVDSAVVYIDFKQDYFTREGLTPPPNWESKSFQKFVRGIFRMRRKTIRNNLKGLVDEQAIESLSSKADHAHWLSARAEELDICQLIELFQLTRIAQ